MCVTNFAKTLNFWTDHFNLKPTDLLHNAEGRDITTFMHLDRGQELVDHHCFFFFEGPKMHVHHSSFEVFDFDTQVLGHDWLIKRGYENCWGVGRHILGSQIFDYWYVCACCCNCRPGRRWGGKFGLCRCIANSLCRFDTSEFILEHYVDGDQVNCDTPITRDVASPDGLYIWGPDLPPSFMG